MSGVRRVAGEGDGDDRYAGLLAEDYRPRTRPLVVWVSASAGSESRFLEDEYEPLSRTVAEAGYPVISGQLGGGYVWGGQTGLDRIERLWRFGAEELEAKPGPMLGIGVSKGAAALL